MSDDWDFYFCRVDDKPASLFVDLGIHEDAPMPKLREMAWLRLYLRQPRKDGLSGKREFDRLSEVEDALQDAIANTEVKIVYVGRNTSDGCRDFHFYTPDGLQAESCLSQAMVPFPEYEFETGFRADPEWSTYFNFLYPSERDFEMIKNGRLLAVLEQHGDKHEMSGFVEESAIVNTIALGSCLRWLHTRSFKVCSAASKT